MTLKDWLAVLGMFLWNYAGWIWCSIGFLLLCHAIAQIGNVPRQLCPRHGCALRERLDIPGRPICLMCMQDEERRKAYACEHCGRPRQGTPRSSTLCRPCREAEQAGEHGEPGD